MRLQDLNSEVLTEAKVAFRDTKGTRDKVFGYFVGTLETKNMTDDMVKFYKDAAKMNKLVKFVADIVGKSKTGTKYTITDVDLSKLSKAGIKNRSDLPKKDFNLLGGKGVDTSSKSDVESVTKTTTQTNGKQSTKTSETEKPKGIDKDSLKKTNNFNYIGGIDPIDDTFHNVIITSSSGIYEPDGFGNGGSFGGGGASGSWGDSSDSSSSD